MMRFVEATTSYENWLGKQMPLIAADLDYKHDQMSRDIFRFLRGTYYRWAQVFPEICGELAKTPAVLSVGDLHADNFGTWRDLDGRLVWGINDFDEAYVLPYTNDLVRLAASLRLAIEAGVVKMDVEGAYQAVLDGYNEWLFSDGRPFVLAEKASWLRALAQDQLRDPVAFWDKIKALPPLKGRAPVDAKAMLDQALPEKNLDVTIAPRRAGMGSLGRIRLVASGKWRGGMIARETKAMAQSACVWALSAPSGALFNDEIRNRAVRCPDPLVWTKDGWIVRRLSPDCSKIDLAEMPKAEEPRFIHAMGRETANIHHGSPRMIDAVRKDFSARQKRSPRWLALAADNMVQRTNSDWREWRAANVPKDPEKPKKS